MKVSAYAPVQRIVGVLLIFLSLGFLPPMLFALFSDDGTLSAFSISLFIVAAVGVALYLPVRQSRRDLRIRDGFLVVVACWGAVCLAGAVPFVLAIDASVADAVFESTSGITTTGATVFTGLDEMPTSILWYRQQLQWMGGLGIIVLAVAILPMLRIGGMQVYKAEVTGPVKESRLTPRIAETAKALWLIYIGLTVLCAAAYWAAGMSLFDAVGHSFSTIATAGFSTHDASIGHFDSALIDWLVVFFIFVASLNFGLHYLALRRATAQVYLRDPELKLFVLLLLMISVVATLLLWQQDVYASFWDSLRHAVFQSVSYMTTTGFATAEVYTWPGTLPLLLLLISAFGGCAGATTGGFKIIRVYLLTKQGVRELKRLVHPRAVVPLKLGGRTLNQEVANAVWGFVSLYILCVVVLTLVVSGIERDLVTAVSVVFSSMNNLGPALGQAGSNYGGLADATKWLMSFAMLLGRLEIFTILVLLTPAYWKH
ncbi:MULTISPECIES: TrkH family potassium uptake protein [unclassified Wenzhouxiangella]|uniref:TrkH family potassium uptake protein n=1 Tax=unclassified Wenzhouxiangella TaxID=2613841 RepID=UPI000E32A91C|nr:MULTISPECIES: TrkH family potassium uptake protein [unclassified Wenzhouxiangella]RFF27155.1 potassium transporter [Wenzhouxiangella sp. 15181]RFP69158.1 potassium transporter [Wenzhouxiangella sp. 15190]